MCMDLMMNYWLRMGGDGANIDVPKRLHFVVPVWGEAYVSLYLSHTLPSHLAIGNLPSIPKHEICYRIITDAEGKEKISQSAIFAQLIKYAGELIFESVDDLVISEISKNASVVTYTYAKMTACHQMGLFKADQEDSAIFFLNADSVYSIGSFVAARNLLHRGIRVIEIVSPRVVKETVINCLDKYLLPSGELNIAPHDLISIATQNLHNISKKHFWKGSHSHIIPDNIYWAVDDEGIVARCTHFHPLALYPRIKFCHFKNSIDHDLIHQLGVSATENYVVTDSTQLSAIEISTAGHDQCFPTFRRGSIHDCVHYINSMCLPRHVANLRYNVHLYAKKPTRNKWVRVDREANRVVENIYKLQKYNFDNTNINNQPFMRRFWKYLGMKCFSARLKLAFKFYNYTKFLGFDNG